MDRGVPIACNCVGEQGDAVSSVQFSPVLDRLGRRGDMRNDSAEILFQFFSAEDPCEQFWNGRGCPFLDVVHALFCGKGV